MREGLEILEEAAGLLRRAPIRAVVAYLTGAVPFYIALLFFLNDMTRSPFAFERLAPESLALAALYVWKNVWQAIYSASLYETLTQARARFSWKLIAVQSALQPIGIAVVLPFPWVVAFLRNVSIFAAIVEPDAVRQASRQASLKPAQNWTALLVVGVAGLILFLNIFIVIALLPQLGRSFLGIEGNFARLGVRIVNPGTLAAAAALAWMMIDPLLDAMYVLRCYYGASIATGEDLRAALKRAIAAVALLLVIAPLKAQVNPDELDQSIDRVIHDREFTWRAPRTASDAPPSKIVGWIESSTNLIKRAWDALWRALREWFQNKPQPDSGGKDSPVTRKELGILIGAILALMVGITIFFLRRKKPEIIEAQAVSVINVADESVTADQAPEGEWLRLADEWMNKGDFRLALRAMYLAGLNFLSEQGLVSIKRWKSGLDYRRELERRSKSKPEVAPAFARGIAVFERGWYGAGADREMVENFAATVAEIRGFLR